MTVIASPCRSDQDQVEPWLPVWNRSLAADHKGGP